MKAIAKIFCSLLIVLFSLNSFGQCPETNIISLSGLTLGSGTGSQAYQSFTMPADGKPGTITFRSWGNFGGGGTSNIIAEIREGEGAGGTLLYTHPQFAISLPSGTSQRNHSFTIPVELSPLLNEAQQYTLVLNVSGSSFSILHSQNDDYAGGQTNVSSGGRDLYLQVNTYNSYPAEPVITGATELCNGPITLNATGEPTNTFQWYKDGVALADELTESLSVLEAGTYSVLALEGDCKTFSQPHIVTSNFGINIQENDTIFVDEEIEIFGINRNQAGIYTEILSGQASNGCDSLVIKELVVLFDPPNASCGDVITLNGVDDYVEVVPIDFADNTQFTVEYFFKGSTPQSAFRIQDGGGYLVAGWTAGGSQVPQHLLSWDLGGLTIGTDILDNQWHHIAVTWERGTTNGYRSYVDGELVAQRNAGSGFIPDFSSTDAFIGSYIGVSEFANGSFDELRIWNVARTEVQIKAAAGSTYEEIVGVDDDGLLAYFDFNDTNPLLTTTNRLSSSADTLRNMKLDSWTQEDGTPTKTSYSVESFTISSGETMMIGGVEQSTPGWYLHETLTSSQTGCDSLIYYDLIIETHNQEIVFSALSPVGFGEEVTLSATGGLSSNEVTFESSDPSVATISGNTLTAVGLGTATITASQEGGIGFNSALPVEQNLVVGKGDQGTLNIDFDGFTGRTYGDTVYIDLGPVETPGDIIWSSSDENIASFIGSTQFQNSGQTYEVGEFALLRSSEVTISFFQQETETYNEGDVGSITSTVEKATIYLDAEDITRAYGEENTEPVFTVAEGFVFEADGTNGTSDLSGIEGLTGELAFVYSRSETPTVNSAPGETFSYRYDNEEGLMSTNYQFDWWDYGTLTIVKATLSAKAQDIAKIYGEVNPMPSVIEYTGFKNGEGTDGSSDLSGLSGLTGSSSAELDPSVTTETGIGTYPINVNVSSVSSDNYNFESDNTGVLEINPRPIEVTADSQSKTYGDADPGFTYQISSGSLVGTDSFTGSLMREAGEDVGDYAIEIGNLSAGENYNASLISNNLTISTRDIKVTADAQSKVYGELDPELTYQITSGSLVSSDILSGSLIRANGEDVGSYAISQGTLANSNYGITYESADLTIGKATLIVTADDKTKTYNTANPTLTISYGSFNSGDTEADLDVTPSASTTAFTASDAGTYPITLSAGDDNNYDFQYVNGILTVTKAPTSITLSNLEQDADGTPKEPTVTTDPANLNVEITYIGGIAPITAGDYDFTVRIDETNYQGEESGTLKLVQVLGLTDTPVRVYPNPAQEYLIIESDEVLQIEVMNLEGKRMMQNTSTRPMNLTSIPEGMYLLRLTNKQGEYQTIRFMKKSK